MRGARRIESIEALMRKPVMSVDIEESCRVDHEIAGEMRWKGAGSDVVANGARQAAKVLIPMKSELNNR